MLEISTAVFTKDHELQRFDGMIAAVNNKTIYAKLSPIHKESDRKMAGDTKFDYRIPYALVHKDPEFNGAVPEHFDLPVIKNLLTKKKSYVEKDEHYVSCPKPISEFNEFLTTIIKTNISSFDKAAWLEKTRIELEKFTCRLAWTKTLECIELEDITKNNSARTRWEDPPGRLLTKINRFGHAMDPERGMLVYFFTFKNNKKQKARMWFSNKKTWHGGNYKQIERWTEKHGKHSTKYDNKLLKTSYDHLRCFMYGASLYPDMDKLNVWKQELKDYKTKSESKPRGQKQKEHDKKDGEFIPDGILEDS